jgi:peptide/nickel transport system ATP-binding protein
MPGETTAKPVILEIDHLSVEYATPFQRTPAVRDLSLKIFNQEVYGLVGETGCGKSTVALACMRYLPKGTRLVGAVRLLGQDLLKIPDRQLRRLRGNRVAMVYQDPLSALNPSLRILSQMVEILRVHENASENEAQQRCLELLEKVRLADPTDVARRYPHQLSGGMQQRVIIAMALLMKPALLIMDEPTASLDVTIESAVLDLVNDLRQEFNTAILFISHNLGLIARFCTRVGVMYAGEMVEEADVGVFFRYPQHPYTSSLLRCIPRADNNKSENPLWSIPGRVPPLHSLPHHCIFAARCELVQPECRQTQPRLVSTAPDRLSRCLFWQQLAANLPAGERVKPIPLRLNRKTLPFNAGLVVDGLKVHFQVSKENLPWSFKKQTIKAVDGISFHLPAQNIIGIVGESGCGKTALARAIAGLSPIRKGQISLSGEDLTQPVNKRRKDVLQLLQMVFQNPDSTLNPHKTVEQELRRPLRQFKVVERSQEDRTIDQLLAAVNLDRSYRQRYPAQLSGGERQRVAIARSLASAPHLILCDEPTSSLDVSVQSMILNLLHQFQHEYNLSMLFISHDLGVVRYLSDYIGVMYLGQLCEYGNAKQVFEPPHHPYTAALLSALSPPDPTAPTDRLTLEGNIPSAIQPPRGCRFHTRCPRKIGPICELIPPPPNQSGEHLIFCHIQRAELV